MNCRECGDTLREDVYPEQVRVRKSDGATCVIPERTIVTCDNPACRCFSVTLNKVAYPTADLTVYYNVRKDVPCV